MRDLEELKKESKPITCSDSPGGAGAAGCASFSQTGRETSPPFRCTMPHSEARQRKIKSSRAIG